MGKMMVENKEKDDNKRLWHPEFTKYVEFIVSHKNYQGLFFERGADSRVKWVVAGKSEKGKKRRQWWDQQCERLGIKIEAGCYAKVALAVHPTKMHACQICGRTLSLEYVYPNKRTLAAIERLFEVHIAPYTQDIFEIMDELVKSERDIVIFKQIFGIKGPEPGNTLAALKSYIRKNYVDTYAKGFLSPGAMSNSPDRFDGFHSDGACCRHESDKGRHTANLQRYGQDRRVYENWSDGNWKMADRLMSEFRKCGLSADHIGPISLGFCHRPKFHPLTTSENSAKNNRMSLRDVQTLLQDEKKKEVVVSWHSKAIWDRLKLKVKSDLDAIKLSNLMRRNMHHVLIVFSMIDERGHKKFLESILNPGYSFYDYRFEGFDPKTGSYLSAVEIRRTGKNQQNNVDRYYRVAFEALNEYKAKENRKVNKWQSEEVDRQLSILFDLLDMKRYTEAKGQLSSIFELLAEQAERSW